MNNPLEILTTFDRHLEQKTELTLFGRSALALGFPNPDPIYEATHDVDAILPNHQLETLRDEPSFWFAQENTNQQLKSKGLYITHLFSEMDIIIRPEWVDFRIAIPLSFKHLLIYRPAVVDLVLTKMMRGDADDLADIRFLLHEESVSASALEAAFARARIPDLIEIRDIFRNVQPKVLSIAQELERGFKP
jgi:hypothetical protein